LNSRSNTLGSFIRAFTPVFAGIRAFTPVFAGYVDRIEEPGGCGRRSQPRPLRRSRPRLTGGGLAEGTEPTPPQQTMKDCSAQRNAEEGDKDESADTKPNQDVMRSYLTA
jgi:hypothetical protein